MRESENGGSDAGFNSFDKNVGGMLRLVSHDQGVAIDFGPRRRSRPIEAGNRSTVRRRPCCCCSVAEAWTPSRASWARRPPRGRAGVRASGRPG